MLNITNKKILIIIITSYEYSLNCLPVLPRTRKWFLVQFKNKNMA